jgi:hypothetical protein
MNRAQRRHSGNVRKAALSLLIAGTLASGGAAIAHAGVAELVGDLVIQGGGGGGGGGSTTSAGVGAGGGGYITYTVDGDIGHQFGGGGDSIYLGTTGGSIGGGLGFGPMGIVLGGSSGSIASPNGDPATGVADAISLAGVPASGGLNSLIPGAYNVVTFRGSDATENVAGNGSGASVAAEELDLVSLTLISGEAGWDYYGVQGGLGGSAIVSASCLNAKTVNLIQAYPDYHYPSGPVEFYIDTYIAGVGYYFNVAGQPDIEIADFEFDITGAAAGDTLLTVSGWTLDPNTPFTMVGTPSTLSVGDSIVLIDGIDESSFSPISKTVGNYTFEVHAVGSNLVATVTAVGETVIPGPDPKPEVPATGDGLIASMIVPMIVLSGLTGILTVMIRIDRRKSR